MSILEDYLQISEQTQPSPFDAPGIHPSGQLYACSCDLIVTDSLWSSGIGERLLRYFHRVEFEGSETVFEANSPGNRLYFLESGDVDMVAEVASHSPVKGGLRSHVDLGNE